MVVSLSVSTPGNSNDSVWACMLHPLLVLDAGAAGVPAPRASQHSEENLDLLGSGLPQSPCGLQVKLYM